MASSAVSVLKPRTLLLLLLLLTGHRWKEMLQLSWKQSRG
jgi:hypothetical protein